MPGRVAGPTRMAPRTMMAKGGMSRKHFRAMADILRSEGDAPGHREKNESMAHRIADYLATENPRFDRKRFLDASGYDDAYFQSRAEAANGKPVKKAKGGRAKASLSAAKEAAAFAKGGKR